MVFNCLKKKDFLKNSKILKKKLDKLKITLYFIFKDYVFI